MKKAALHRDGRQRKAEEQGPAWALRVGAGGDPTPRWSRTAGRRGVGEQILGVQKQEGGGPRAEQDPTGSSLRMLWGAAPSPSPGGCPHPRTFPFTSQAALDTKMPLVLEGGMDEHRDGCGDLRAGAIRPAARTAAEEAASLGGDT